MAKQLIEDTTLISLGDAIRTHLNSNIKLSPDEMIAAIKKFYVPKDILTQKNLSNWTKNLEFGGTISYSDTGIEQISIIKNFNGISGYERLYYPITVSKNTNYIFTVDFCSPTGFVFKDHDNMATEYGGEQFFVMGTEPSGSWSPNSLLNGTFRFDILGRSSALKTTASNEYIRYSIPFNSGNYTTIYLVLSMGYMQDSTPIDLNFKNLALY